MNEKWKFEVMKMKITNEEMLFKILANPEQYPNLQDVEFDDDFLNSIQFKLKIEGTTLENISIQGHITTDLLNVCNAGKMRLIKCMQVLSKVEMMHEVRY